MPANDGMPATLFEDSEKRVQITFAHDNYFIMVKNESVFYQNCSSNEGFGKIIQK